MIINFFIGLNIQLIRLLEIIKKAKKKYFMQYITLELAIDGSIYIVS